MILNETQSKLTDTSWEMPVFSKQGLTGCNLFITIDNMKVLMDSDCLIKITKASLKEKIVSSFSVFIPYIVKTEVVDAGLKKNFADAIAVRENLAQKKIQMAGSKKSFSKGDFALLELFHPKKYDFVATDDAKLIKFLRIKNIPFILPSLLLYLLYKKKNITRKQTLRFLEKLKHFISFEEYSTVKILMEK